MKAPGRLLIALLAALMSLSAMSQRQRHDDDATSDDEIRVGNLTPYTGALSEFASIGKAEAAYFQMINDRGGINGRKIRFISRDDNSDPSVALDLTKGLVERDNVLLMFNSFGTPGNLAVRKYLNERQVPQLFVASGDEQLSNPATFPWTMGWQPSFRAEGRIYANYIQASYPDRKIVVLWQNDQFGRDVFRGFEEGLGDLARMILVDVAFDITDQHIESHVSILKRSGADILVFAGVPSTASQVIRLAADSDWHPVFILASAAASIDTALKPAGTDKSQGVISTAFLKDPSDPAWKGDPAIKEWSAFVGKYYPQGNINDSSALYGYAAAETLVQVLKQCGADLSSDNVMRQAESLKDYQPSVMLPGIRINTAPSNFQPIKQLRLMQFDGSTWQPIGDVLETAFSEAPKR